MDRASSDPDTLVTDAVRHLQAGDLAAAELACRSVLSVTSQHISANSILGAVLMQQGRHAEAKSIFSDLLEREPGAMSHWVNLGIARRRLREFDGALAAFARAAELGTQEPDFYFNVGLTHLDRGDFESARMVLDRARQLDSLDAEIQLRYADACYRSLQNDAAAAALANWRSFEAKSAPILALIAQLLVNLGEQQEGEFALDAALADPGADAATLLTGVEIAERTNRAELAQALIARLEAEPRSSAIDEDLLAARARLAQNAGDHATAERLYNQVLLAVSDSATKFMKLFPLAQSLDALGRYDSPLGVDRCEVVHEAADVHRLVRAGRRGRELEDGVRVGERRNRQRHREDVMDGVRERDGIVQGVRLCAGDRREGDGGEREYFHETRLAPRPSAR